MFTEFLYRVHTTEDERIRSGLTPELRHLQRYLGRPSLSESLVAANIRRAVDVGVGADCEQVKHLASQTHDGNPVFAPLSIWAVDIKLLDNARRNLRGWEDRIVAQGLSAQDLKEKVASGDVLPFDLIVSKGVLSVLLGNKIAEAYERSREVLQALQGCLNPQNPNAMLLLSNIGNEELVLASEPDFNNAGLQLVYGNKVPSDSAMHHGWGGILQRGDYFPPEPYDGFYDLAICKTLPIL